MIDPIGTQRGYIEALNKKQHKLLLKRADIDVELKRIADLLQEQGVILRDMIAREKAEKE